MTALERLQTWLEMNPPAQMPYWPGARVTTPFGIRTSQAVLQDGGSPLHLGIDRAGGGTYHMPFDGLVSWRVCGGDAGSLLQLSSDCLPLEVQVFHTWSTNRYVDEISTRLSAGDRLPVVPSNVGKSKGVHTHTEIVVPHDAGIRDWCATGATWIVRDEQINHAYILQHCQAHHLDAGLVLERLVEQLRTWAITQMSDRFAIREELPAYRRPRWGHGPVLHIDSMWLLRI